MKNGDIRGGWYRKSWIIDGPCADSIYTERFMGLPTDNPHGYERSQLLNKVDNIKTKMYYLIHGTLDDNVHYQQSLLLAKVLEQKDILFRQQVRRYSIPEGSPRSSNRFARE